jgi:hypothetical protein
MPIPILARGVNRLAIIAENVIAPQTNNALLSYIPKINPNALARIMPHLSPK